MLGQKLPIYFQLATLGLRAITPVIQLTPWKVDDAIHKSLLLFFTSEETSKSLELMLSESSLKKGEEGERKEVQQNRNPVV